MSIMLLIFSATILILPKEKENDRYCYDVIAILIAIVHCHNDP